MTRRTGGVLLASGLWFVGAASASAQGVLSVEILNGYNLVVDSNVTTPSTYAPASAYIGGRICNTGNAPLDNVTAYAGDHGGGTPGVFPSFDSTGDPRVFLANTGTYSLTLEAGGTGTADGTRYIGTLGAGECRMEYWLISYPQCVSVSDGTGGFAPQSPPCDVSITGDATTADDLSLDYDIWATTTTAIAAPSVSASRDFTMRAELSASANKIWPNTTAKVPDAYLAAIESVVGWGTLGPDGQPLTATTAVYPGQRLITTQGIWYDLGNVGQGFDNDGDLIPDHNAWLQPVGDPSSFDAACFRMVNVYGIVIVKLTTGGELLVPFQNQLYFDHLPDNTGVVGLVYYQFIATDGACTANMTPYQEAASGLNYEKFSADYGLSLGLESRGFGAGLSLGKTDGVDSVTPTDPEAAGDELTYTLTTENRTDNDGDATTTDVGVPIGAPDLGLPLVFSDEIPSDEIPAGTTYIAGSAAAGLVTPRTTTTPLGYGVFMQSYTDRDGNLDVCALHYQITSSAYTILYSTNGGASWVATEPVPASSVTSIRWLLSTTLALDGGHDRTDCLPRDGLYDNGTVRTSLPFDTTSTDARKAAVSFQVDAGTTAGPVLCNTARLGFGEAASGVQAQDCDLVTGNNSLSGTVFRDDGTGAGGLYGNGTRDGTESGIGSGVIVSLYYDRNGDGRYDSGDIVYDATTTDADGNYAFAGIPDGPYVVVVKKYDGATSDGINNAATDAAFGTNGWGDTTFDPNRSLTSVTSEGDAAPWPLKLNESITTVSLAVNIDRSKDTSAALSATNVSFGFAPPFRLTKVVANNADVVAPADVADTPVDEGDLFSYSILLENRLPSVGRQTPTGCEYTVWATTGATGASASNKNFQNSPTDLAATNAYDATGPNLSTAYAHIIAGGNRWLYTNNLTIPQQAGAITKVEGLYFGYFNAPLNNDILVLDVGRSATLGPDGIHSTSDADSTTATLYAAQIDSYVGPPPNTDPNNAIAWDITSLRPGGSPWSWADFPTMQLQASPSKTSGADAQTFYLDAVGLRVTTDAACEASASTTLSPVPLQDRFDVGRIAFVSADPAPTSVDTANGVIRWANVGPILPGSSRTVTVTARALNVAGTQNGSCPATPPTTEPGGQPWNNNCNYAQSTYSTFHVMYADGRQANDDYDKMAVTLQGKAEIHGVVWNDNNVPTGTTGWPKDGGEQGLSNVTVTLWACVRSDGVTLESNSANKTCAAETSGNYWRALATDVTDANGAYDFIGLDTGTYIVEVGNTDNAPETGNASPYSGTQTAEPNDSQAVDVGGGAVGTDGVCLGAGGCNNTWGDPDNYLSTMNQLGDPSTEEIINGVNFGYFLSSASLYGRVWHDVDGDAGPSPFTFAAIAEPGETGLAGFTVTLSGAASATATTDTNGDYSFAGLAADLYTITITPPTLRNKAWAETVESTGGTGDLNNSLSLTIAVGQPSGSHDFGYTLKDASTIGDTVFLDLDGDGSQDSTETGIPNITVWLYHDVDRDGTIDSGVDDLVATDVTDASGKYLFGPNETGAAQVTLAGGSYVVVVDTNDSDFPSDTTPTADPDVATGRIGDRVYLDAAANGPSTRSVASATTNGSTIVTSAGLFLPSDVGATISGTGVPAGATITAFISPSEVQISAAATATGAPTLTVGNDGDDGIPNVVVVLYEDADGNGSLSYASDRLVAATTTDASGRYLFTGLHAGSYFVDVADSASEPNGNTLPTSQQGAGNQLVLVGTDPKTTLITLATNDSSVLTADAGYSPSATFAIGDRVWADADGDGVQDPGEAGIAGVTIRVTNGTGTGCPVATPCTATTDAVGFWMVTGLGAGSFTVDVVSTTAGILDAPRNFRVTNGAEPRTVTVGAADLMSVDFGFRYSTDATLTDREATDPTGLISGRVFLDADGNAAYDAGEARGGTTVNLLDENGYIIATTTTGADGMYYFGGRSDCTMTTSPACSGIFIGLYAVQAVDSLGTRYSTIFVANATAFPNLNVIYTTAIETTPDSQSSVSVDGVHADLMQDFGYRRFLGSIGDTIYLDANQNATQDGSEPGISGVLVELYSGSWSDTNGNGLAEGFEVTGRTLLQQATTTTDDPLTPGDESGHYLFANLPSLARNVTAGTTNGSNTATAAAGVFSAADVGRSITGFGIPTGTVITTYDGGSGSVTLSANATVTGSRTLTVTTYYFVNVVTATLPGTPTLTADPDTDGVSCVGYTPAGVCDSAQLVRGFSTGINYLGADFGYNLAGYGFFGDQLWIDTNGDGLKDSTEPGIPFVTVWIDTDNDGVVDAGEPATSTDASGLYLFSGLANGTYNVRVLTSDPDWPTDLPTTPTFEVRTNNTTSRNNSIQVVITGGVVTAIVDGDGSTPDACVGCDLASDFGYRYTGANSLNGTVCLEASGALDGYCGATPTTYYGVATGESAFSGLQVHLYEWADSSTSGFINQAWDPTTGAMDAADTFTYWGATTTGAGGDYSFGGVPDNVVVLVGVAAAQNLDLTTTNGNTSVEDAGVISRQLFEGTAVFEGRTVTVLARQALSLAGDADHEIYDLDFAFDGTLGGTLTNDFGDLPDSGSPDYNATLLASGGAEHRVTAGSIHLGASVDTETDGHANADATGDLFDDGVSLVSTNLNAGPAGGAVTVVPSAAGWIAGWIDFNRDGDFADSGEQILNGAVDAAQTIPFDVPYEFNEGQSGSNIVLFARFRIYPSEPLMVSSTGVALDSAFQVVTGEVEDYRWTVDLTLAVISAFGARETRGGMAIEWRTSAESGTIGFYLRRWDAEADRYVNVNERLLPAVLEVQGGRYSYIDAGAAPGVEYQYELTEVEASGRRNVYGPYTVNTSAARPQRSASLAERVTLAAEASGYARFAHARLAPLPRRQRAATLSAWEAALPLGRGRATAARIRVSESGIYALDPRALRPLPPAGSLTNQGLPVAVTDAPGLGGGLLFYGQALDSLYARDNVYQLRTLTRSSPHMRVRPEHVMRWPSAEATFTRNLHVEQDLLPAITIFDDPEADYWLWDWLFAGDVPKSFTFRAESVAAGSAEPAALTVRLKGGSETTANPDHHALVRLNGQELGDVSWNGLDPAEVTLTFDVALLSEGDNTVEVEALTDTGAEYSLFFLDSFDLRYPSLYRALGNRLECTSDDNESFQITGFTRPDILVFDVSNPRRPVEVKALVRRTPDRRYAVALAPPRPGITYYAVTPDAFLQPTSLEPDWPSPIRSSRNAAEYLLVTTSELKQTAQQLADYRSDLSSLVVDIQDVYDEFGYGLPTPHALRAFLHHAYTRWATPPRYVVLVGDGSYDYKDAYGAGGNLIPPKMIRTPNGLYASDVWLADVDTAGPAPEMAIGRLPVASVAELEATIQKIQTREAALGQPWLRRMLVVADNPDRGGSFTMDSESIAALAPPEIEVERAYLEQLGAVETRNRLLAGLNEGSGMVSYVGHGGYDVLADEGLLWNQDVDTLTNATRPTVMTAMTCAASDFALPGYPSITESLVRKATGGAAAVWGPTGLSENVYAVGLARGYYSQIFAGGEGRIGDAIAASLRAYEATGGPAYMAAIYVLLGDPAMRLH